MKIQTQMRYLFVHKSVVNEKGSHSHKNLYFAHFSITIHHVKNEMLGVIAAAILEVHSPKLHSFYPFVSPNI